jgi:hypothetical protein
MYVSPVPGNEEQGRGWREGWQEREIMTGAWELSPSVALVLLYANKSVEFFFTFYIYKLGPRPGQARAEPRFMALAWPRIWESWSHLRPSQAVTALSAVVVVIGLTCCCSTPANSLSTMFKVLKLVLKHLVVILLFLLILLITWHCYEQYGSSFLL